MRNDKLSDTSVILTGLREGLREEDRRWMEETEKVCCSRFGAFSDYVTVPKEFANLSKLILVYLFCDFCFKAGRKRLVYRFCNYTVMSNKEKCCAQKLTMEKIYQLKITQLFVCHC